MKLSAPIYVLKRKAKLLCRSAGIPLHEALDRIALDEGFAGWSLLAARAASVSPARKLFERLNPGDMVLIGARPGQGKTLLSLELAVEAMNAGRRAAFFTLEYTSSEVRDRLRDVGVDPARYEASFDVDCSDAICAEYIRNAMRSAEGGTLVIVDYLQLLDQKRENPELTAQVRSLRAFAKNRGLVIAFISQIVRTFDTREKTFPGLPDVRLPNPLDLGLFDKACFLHQGEIRFQSAKARS